MRCVVLLVLFLTTAWGDVVEITGENYAEIFQGEWMVLFYAPWCPACQRVKPIWKDFSSWGKDLSVHVGQCDVTKNPGLSGQFVITGLPSIFHIKDGESRQYKGSKESSDLLAFVDEKKWTTVQPVAWWMAPNTLQMRAVGSFFTFANFVRSLHTVMTEDYDVPSWGAYVIFAIVTILLGLALGFTLVVLLDCVCPQKRPQQAAASAACPTKPAPQRAEVKRVPAVSANSRDVEPDAVAAKPTTGAATKTATLRPAATAVEDNDDDSNDVIDVSNEEEGAEEQGHDADKQGHGEEQGAELDDIEDEHDVGTGGEGDAGDKNGVPGARENISDERAPKDTDQDGDQKEKKDEQDDAAEQQPQPTADEGEPPVNEAADAVVSQQGVRRRNKPKRI